MRSPIPCALLTIFTASTAAYAETRPSGSTVAIDPLGRGTWIVDQERQEVGLISGTGDVKRVPVGAWPEQLAVLDDGTVFVSCRHDGRIDVVSPDFNVSSIEVGTEPRAIALDEAGHNLYVALVTEKAVARIDTKYRVVLAKRRVELTPYTMALTPAGVAVAGAKDDSIIFLPRELDGTPAPVVTLAPEQGSKRKPWHIQALATEGEELFVIHANVDTGLSEPSFSGGYGGGVVQPILMAVSTIRAGAKPARPMLIGHAGNLEAKDVQSALVHRKLLYVASRATKQLLVAAIVGKDRPRLSPSEALNLGHGVNGFALAPNGRMRTLISFDRSLADVAVRVRAFEILTERDHYDYGTNSIAVAMYSQKHPLELESKVSIGEGKYDAELALGRQLFHDALSNRLSAGQTACVTCHPDGREDGLVWRLGGTRRQTPLLAGRLAVTAPFNWEGTTATLEKNIVQTIERLGGFGINKVEVRALARFVSEGLPKPKLAPVRDSSLIAHGEKLFFDPSVGCASCHPADAAYADGENWNVESTSAEELAELDKVNPPKVLRRGKGSKKTKVIVRAPVEYNTPSLKFVSLSAPYFHDGSANTLEELIAMNNDRMGTTTRLGEDDKRALVAYLSSL